MATKSFPPAPWNFHRFIPARQEMINTINDWPQPILGVIYLEDNTEYLVGDNLADMPHRFELGRFTVVRGINVDSANIESSTSGALFTATDKSYLIEDITVDVPNGAIFDHNDTDGEFAQVRNMQVSDCDSLGSFHSDGGGVWFFRSFIATAFNDGFSFSGDWNVMQLEVASDVQILGCFLDFGTATFNSIGVQGASLFLVTGTACFIKGAANSANLNLGSLGRVSNCVINNLGGGTILDGVTVDDIRWRFLNNQAIRDTRPDVLSTFTGNTEETVITTQSVPVKVNADDLWMQDHASQFTTSIDGRLTFIGEIEQRLPIDFQCLLKGVTGSARDFKICVAVNGTAIAASAYIITDVTNTKTKSGATRWQYMFTTGDYVELFISNEGGTNNVIVENSLGRIN